MRFWAGWATYPNDACTLAERDICWYLSAGSIGLFRQQSVRSLLDRWVTRVAGLSGRLQ